MRRNLGRGTPDKSGATSLFRIHQSSLIISFPSPAFSLRLRSDVPLLSLSGDEIAFAGGLELGVV